MQNFQINPFHDSYVTLGLAAGKDPAILINAWLKLAGKSLMKLHVVILSNKRWKEIQQYLRSTHCFPKEGKQLLFQYLNSDVQWVKRESSMQIRRSSDAAAGLTQLLSSCVC